ncbi:DUF3237 family protein [Youngiibacter multivorans]|uniref:DUF3237 domain-containing protein n=1 Tax=Youngiibacter multivorans TaxID=937251 RepID=A0ABS4G5R3_9CLOT|nr:DUF3237 family protein [Youngiibacter multivorans]MBP1919625.1 hypothetical protein [Youngiibacter multivorans]
MGDKLILEISIDLIPDDRLQVETSSGTIFMKPFTGVASGEIFKGIILPGGVDTQLVDVNSIKHMSARYMLEGIDYLGAKCRIFIENNGFFHTDAPKPFKTIPTFYTDSKALAPYLHCNKFRAEGQRGSSGLVIKIFEICGL